MQPVPVPCSVISAPPKGFVADRFAKVSLACPSQSRAACSAGYGSYGPPPEWLRGARVVLLLEGQAPGDAQSWIRLENGSRIDQVAAMTAHVSAQAQEQCDAGKCLCC